jgi:hypothetical protein
VGYLPPVLVYAADPTVRFALGLIFALQQMQDDIFKPAANFMVFAPDHICQLLKKIFPVEEFVLSGANELRLRCNPEDEIVIVGRRGGCFLLKIKHDGTSISTR